MTISVSGAPAEWIKDGLQGDERASAYCEEFGGGNFIVFLNRYYIGHSLRKKPRLSRFVLWLTCLPWWPSCWSYQANYGGNATASSMTTKWGAIRECRRWLAKEATGET